MTTRGPLSEGSFPHNADRSASRAMGSRGRVRIRGTDWRRRSWRWRPLELLAPCGVSALAGDGIPAPARRRGAAPCGQTVDDARYDPGDERGLPDVTVEASQDRVLVAGAAGLRSAGDGQHSSSHCNDGVEDRERVRLRAGDGSGGRRLLRRPSDEDERAPRRRREESTRAAGSEHLSLHGSHRPAGWSANASSSQRYVSFRPSNRASDVPGVSLVPIAASRVRADPRKDFATAGSGAHFWRSPHASTRSRGGR